MPHNTSVVTFPSKFVKMVNQAITEFVWNKKAKIKQKTDRSERKIPTGYA